MTIPVKLRRSGTTTATPSSLEYGEIAINYADGVVFYRDSSDVIQSFTLQAYALSSHTHAASDITSGTLDAARLPLATTGAVGGVIVGTGLGVSSGTVSVTYGTTSGTACQGNDSRLSDTRTPTDGSVTTAKIADDAVTYAKIQNVSTTDRLLGRSSAGSGDVEEVPCTAFGRSLIDDADATAARTTLGAAPLASPTFTGTVTVPGLTATAAILADDLSSANSVVYSFDGDPNTGVGRGGADILTLVTNGSERVRVDASGTVGIASASTAATYAGWLRIGPMASSSLSSNGGLEFVNAASSSGWGWRISNLDAGGGAVPLVFESRSNSTSWVERIRISESGSITAAQIYSDTVGATNRDLFIDNTGKLGYVSSIRASKTGITAIDDVSWLRDLTPVSFHYRRKDDDGNYTDDPDGTLGYGLIAEDVEPVAPEMCFYDVVDGEPQLRGVHYSKLITPMLRYIQQLEQRIAALEEKLNHA